MSRREELQALLERVRGATEGNWDLDVCAMYVLGFLIRRNVLADYPDQDPIWAYSDNDIGRGLHDPMVGRVSTHIDAAIALVERVLPGWNVEICILGGNDGYATIYGSEFSDCDMDQYAQSEVMKPPLAILAALLSVLIAKEGLADVQ